ncbi:hypothetical protein LEMLEM_LOCUS23239, partial [Lemmus lemmus]
ITAPLQVVQGCRIGEELPKLIWFSFPSGQKPHTDDGVYDRLFRHMGSCPPVWRSTDVDEGCAGDVRPWVLLQLLHVPRRHQLWLH